MPKLNKRTISVFVIAVIALYIVIAVIPKLTGVLTPTETIKYGNLEVADKAKCFIVRDETVYSAPASGKMKFTVDEATQVKKGADIMKFTASADGSKKSDKDADASGSKYKDIISRLGNNMKVSKGSVSERKGEISFYVDGFESFFTTDRMKNFSYSDMKGTNIDPENLRRTSAKKGEPVYKICDNSAWYIVFWVDKAHMKRYTEGSDVTAELPGGSLHASVYAVKKDGTKSEIILKTNRYYRNFTSDRIIEGKIITVSGYGLIIHNSSMTYKDGKRGVYAKDTADNYVFKPVNVLSTDGSRSIVSESTFFDKKGDPVNTVEVYDEIKKHPGR